MNEVEIIAAAQLIASRNGIAGLASSVRDLQDRGAVVRLAVHDKDDRIFGAVAVSAELMLALLAEAQRLLQAQIDKLVD